MPAVLSIWTDDRVASLTKWWNEGYSCSQIAGMLEGTTRNAVIGKLSRLGLQSPKENKFDSFGGKIGKQIAGMASRRKPPKSPRAPPRAGGPKLIIDRSQIRCDEVVPRHKHLLDLEPGDCRYPYGDSPFTFCGHQASEGSYCMAHFVLTTGAGTPSERAATKVSVRHLEPFA